MHSLLQKDLTVRNLQMQGPVLTTEPEDLSDAEGNDESSTYELWAPPPSAMPEYEVPFLIRLNRYYLIYSYFDSYWLLSWTKCIFLLISACERKKLPVKEKLFLKIKSLLKRKENQQSLPS